MKRRCFPLLLVLAVMAAACSPFVSPRAAKRHVRMTVIRQDTISVDSLRRWANWVDFSVFSLSVPPPPPSRDLFSLAGEGQAAFIQAMAAQLKEREGAVLPQALASAIQQERLPTMRDLGLVKRRVVFSVENRSTSPADRLVAVRLRLRPDQDSVRFLNWDKLATVHEVIDLGSLTFGQTVTAGAELGAALGALTPNLSTSGQSTLQEQIPLRQRVVPVSGTLMDREAILIQQGGPGQDLTGNVIVDLEMQLPTRPSQTITFVTSPGESDAGIDCSKKPVFRQQVVQIPAGAGRDITGTLIAEYTIRRVRSGHVTLHEGDDEVFHLQGVDTVSKVTLIPSRDLIVRMWSLVDAGGTPLQARLQGQTKLELLQFAGYEDAMRLANWIGQCGAAPISRRELILATGRALDPPALTVNDKPALRIDLVEANVP